MDKRQMGSEAEATHAEFLKDAQEALTAGNIGGCQWLKGAAFGVRTIASVVEVLPADAQYRMIDAELAFVCVRAHK